ncbi:MAG: hypothetical protein R2757_20950 [Draconibacterium sp.]
MTEENFPGIFIRIKAVFADTVVVVLLMVGTSVFLICSPLFLILFVQRLLYLFSYSMIRFLQAFLEAQLGIWLWE